MQVFQVILLVALVATAALAFPGQLYGGYGHYAYPRYNFEYGVHSPYTGDLKNQWQYRDGGVLKGSYSLKEHDRAINRQDYVADGIYGGAYGRYGGAHYGGAASYANTLAVGHFGGLPY